MSLISLTFAGALRVGLLITAVSAGYLAYDHFQTRAVFERTAGQVFRAMDAQLNQTLAETGCLQTPGNATLAGLVNDRFLDSQVISDSPWRLGVAYQTNANHVVVSKTVTLTALTTAQENTLTSLANHLPYSWHYQSPTLTLLEPVAYADHAVMQQDRNSPLGCYDW